MASIPYVIDKNGNKLFIREVNRRSEHICPECRDKVIAKKGQKNAHCFAHWNNPSRTPFQKTCKYYNENDRILDPTDKIYINNGGVPLYLSNNNTLFELRAFFPELSDTTMTQLKNNNTKVYVNSKAQYNTDKLVYSVDNVNFCKIDIINSWIYVSCYPQTVLSEVRRKWLWGIRGIDVENDIYHSNVDGGYRVALKSRISVGKTYRMLFEDTPPIISGINFIEIGEVKLKKEWSRKYCSVRVFSASIILFTKEARSFIDGKGYKLINERNELLPLWPPAVFEGKDLKYEQTTALFVHIDKQKTQNVSYLGGYSNISCIENKNDKSVISVNTHDKTLTISDANVYYVSEIKYNIKKVDCFAFKEIIKPNIVICNSVEIPFAFGDKNIKPPRDGKLYIDSNLPFTAIKSNGDYAISSSEIRFEKIRFFDELTINLKAFGILKHHYQTPKKADGQTNINYDDLYLCLYNCTEPSTSSNYDDIYLLHCLESALNDKNKDVYRLIEYWVKTNKVPLSAKMTLNKLKSFFGGTANE